MLVLSRKVGDKVVIGGNIIVTVLGRSGDTVKLGFEGPSDVPIHREEIYWRLAEERESARHSEPAPVARRQPKARPVNVT